LFFKSFVADKNPPTEKTAKRRKIQQNAAVITAEMISIGKDSGEISDGVKNLNESEDFDLPQLPPPLSVRIKKRHLETPSSTNALSFDKPTPMTMKKLSAPRKRLHFDIDVRTCLYCCEPAGNMRPNEKWIHCRVCEMWAHSECAGVSPSFVNFTCELCL
jgi:hypothetical protein